MSANAKITSYSWLVAHKDHAGDVCLAWPFYRGEKGYGYLGFEGRVLRAHRVMCQLAHGIAPSPGHQAAHSCGRGHEGCVNPRHLSWKTGAENARDKELHGTSGWPNRTARYKLTAEQVAEIRAAKGQSSQKTLAEQFGVSENTISDIWNGKTWKLGVMSNKGKPTRRALELIGLAGGLNAETDR